MKCKVCGGTGTSNTCVNGTFKPCTFCDGTGEYEPFDLDVELDKLDNEPMTNEEYLKSLDTEQLIRFLLWYPYNVHGYPKPKMSIAEEEDAIRKWLKGVHNA